MNARQLVQRARTALEFADTFANVEGEQEAVIRSLRGVTLSLVEYVEALDQPARLAVQHDEEFRNLAAGARSEILRLHAAIKRLAPLEAALTKMLTDGAGQ